VREWLAKALTNATFGYGEHGEFDKIEGCIKTLTDLSGEHSEDEKVREALKVARKIKDG